MPRARQKPRRPVTPDAYIPEAEAPGAMQGVEKQIIERPGRAPIVQRVRNSLIDNLSKPARYSHGQTRPAILSVRQSMAAKAYQEALEATQGGGSSEVRDYVDNSPDWGAIALRGAERQTRLAKIDELIEGDAERAAVRLVIRMQVMTDDVSALRRGLDQIADGLGIG